MPFAYKRVIRFGDTDAAGVVYFVNVLSICHEAYEASLVAANINLKTFFSNPAAAIPIVHADVDFFQPLFCGDEININLQPQQLSNEKFEIIYQVLGLNKQLMAKAITRHVCIHPTTRTRQELTAEMLLWLQLCKE
ncbi:acyl-CoA thioesterase [Synechocystis sp. PCC 7509]|uniref:acyl-CoA thioesterase n=1 Tax=Synechocystis sp. PCC 7509 TaxID=927677 RepID=UPI0002ABE522|nr:thioesterase family protein [Synechocystis sp. PCC 7509]